MKFFIVWVFICAVTVIALIIGCTTIFLQYEPDNMAHIQKLDNPKSLPAKLSPVLDYKMPLGKESFYVFVPENYSDNKKYGLIVFVNNTARMKLFPPGWEKVLSKRDFLFIAPFNNGGERNIAERESVAALAALSMMEKYNIDPNKVYVSGISGGAQVASHLAFLEPEIFAGTIQNCGTNFYKPIKFETIAPGTQTGFVEMWNFGCTKESADKARQKVKFALIAGSEDDDWKYIQEIYEKGFVKDGFKAKYFKIDGMGRENCSPDTLDKVLDYLDGQ